MSRRGDDEEFHPHPGDPWHPGWSSEASGEAEDAATPVGPEETPGRSSRRRRFGRGARRGGSGSEGVAEPGGGGETVPLPSDEAEPAGWWAAGLEAEEGQREEPLDPEAALRTVEWVDEPDAEEEAAPAAPVFPWWEAAAPAAAPPASLVSADLSAGPSTAAPPGEGGEEPGEGGEEPKAAPAAAALIPLDLLSATAAPPPLPAVPGESAMGPPLPPVQTGEGGEAPEELPEEDAGPGLSTAVADLEQAASALLAELGEAPEVEVIEPGEAGPVQEDLPTLPWVPALADVEPTGEPGEWGRPGSEEATGAREGGVASESWPEETASDDGAPAGPDASGLVLAAWEPPAPATPTGPVPGSPDSALPEAGEDLEAAGAEVGAEVEPEVGAEVGAEVEAEVEAEVDEWLAFVEGAPAPASPAAGSALPPAAEPAATPAAPAAEPAATAAAPEAEAVPTASPMKPRRRGWLGRRREVEPAQAGVADEEEAARPPPWLPPAVEELLPQPGPDAGADDAIATEAAWDAWQAGGSEGATGVAEGFPVPAGAGEAAPGEEEDGGQWGEAEWSGEAEPPAAGWYAEIDEDEVAVPPVTLPEEDWEEEWAEEPGWPGVPDGEPSGSAAAARPPELPPAMPAWGEEGGAAKVSGEGDRAEGQQEDEEGDEDDWEEEGFRQAGWVPFPEPGEPLAELRDETEEAAGAGSGGLGAGELEAAGWEAFPEPGMPPPRPSAGRAPEDPPRYGPVLPVADAAAPGEGAGVTGRTREMPPPVFDFERPPSGPGPISEETLAGAVTMEHRGLAEEVAAADTGETELQALAAPMLGLESGVVGFEDVAHLGADEEVAARPRSDLPVRVATGMVLAALLLGSLWVGGEFFAGFVGLLAVLGLGEFYGALRRSGYQPLALFGFPGGVGLLVGMWFYGPVAIPTAVVAVTVLSFFYYAFAPRRRDALTNGGLTILGMLWVTGTAGFAFLIAASPQFRVLVLAVAFTVIAADVGAFFAGRAWGARPMAPVLSPKKTWEGLAGGVILGIGAAVAAGYLFDEVGVRAGAILGLVVAVMAPLGDLAESMVKRSLGIKDMGSILPGHGGILDRIDAFLFVLPAAWVLFETMGLLR